jgi:hypothetical protein
MRGRYLRRAGGRSAVLGVVEVMSHAVSAHFKADHTSAGVVHGLLVVEDRDVHVIVQDARGLALWHK